MRTVSDMRANEAIDYVDNEVGKFLVERSDAAEAAARKAVRSSLASVLGLSGARSSLSSVVQRAETAPQSPRRVAGIILLRALAADLIDPSPETGVPHYQLLQFAQVALPDLVRGKHSGSRRKATQSHEAVQALAGIHGAVVAEVEQLATPFTTVQEMMSCRSPMTRAAVGHHWPWVKPPETPDFFRTGRLLTGGRDGSQTKEVLC